MPLLGFQKQFAPLVESGEKRQTIRAYRKDGRDPKVGETLYLYTGLRTKQCRKLGESRCTEVRPFEIRPAIDGSPMLLWCGYYIGPVCPEISQQTFLSMLNTGADEFARTDGFADRQKMIAWFDKTHSLPFDGLLIRWGDLSK